MEFERSILFGVIFDLAPSYFLNSLKENLIKYILESNISTRMYLHSEKSIIPKDQGESVYAVTTYKHPTNFNAVTTFKETVVVLGERNEKCEKYVVLLTDNFQAAKSLLYRKAFLTNSIRDYGCKIIVCGMANCDQRGLQFLANEYDAIYFNLTEPNEIGLFLKQVLEN